MGFFAFIPILGSAISIVLGMMRANIWVFTLAMSIGKVIRDAIVIWGTLKAASIF
jgi:membrane protein YqaA with SNARE-associated domain